VNELRALEDSSVVALVGPWGSGKTSSIHLIRERLGESWQVCWVNTWASPDVSALLADVFAALRGALPERGRLRGVRERLGEYAQLAIPMLGLVPAVGDTAEAMASNFVQFRASRPMSERFTDLAGELAGLDLRVLVVLDDVDRLEPDELLALFKAVRLLARFPGVYYLIAYDEQTVVDLLKTTAVASGSEARALAYLEKIVQVRLDMPPAQRFHTEQMISAGLGSLLDRLGISLSAEQTARFRVLYDGLLQFTLAQPRAVGTFLRQASVYLPMADPDEVDVIDFLMLTHLRSVAPATYRFLSHSKPAVTAQPGQGADEKWEPARRRVEKELAAECGEHADQVMTALAEMFPALQEEASRLQPGEWLEFAAARRVCIEEYFDRYFLFGMPADDIADATALEAVAAICRAEQTPAREAVEAAIAGSDTGQADRLIGKLIRLSSSPAQRHEGELAAVLAYALALPERFHGGNGLLGSPDHHSLTWARAVIARLISNSQTLDPGFAVGLDDPAFARLCQALGEMRTSFAERTRTLVSIRETVAHFAAERIQEHLRARDHAPAETPIIFLTRFVNLTGPRAALAEMINDDLDHQRFTPEDLASRFVSVAVPAGGRSELAGFDHGTLAALLGLPTLVTLAGTGVEQDVDLLPGPSTGDTSWPARRHVGLASLRQSLPRMRSEPPVPPSGVLAGGQMSPVHQTSPSSWGARITRGAGASDSGPILVCLRAAVLVPGSAGGLPTGVGATTVSEETRAHTVARILDGTSLTSLCRDHAQRAGAEPAPEWVEDGNSSRLFAEFTLQKPDSESPAAVTGHCVITTGASRPGQDALCIAVDLLLSMPRAAPHQDGDDTPAADGTSSRLNLQAVVDLTGIVTRSAMLAGWQTASELLGFTPVDGHLAVWLATERSLDQVIDLTSFPAVGNQGVPAEASIFATLPLEPGQTDDSPDFTRSLRGIGVELVHELLRAAQRRDYIEYLHLLRDDRHTASDPTGATTPQSGTTGSP
jgi:hypothetical protein